MSLNFQDRVVLITGSGGGLGEAYATLFGSLGAKVVVNDFSKQNADKVADKIRKAGGQALANYDSVTEGKKIVDQIIKEYGRIDIIINNAGVLRDKSFKSMTDDEFNLVQEIHVKGAFAVTHAAWPFMRKQKYGRIVNMTSAAGLYGNFGQTNYSAAKMGLVGFAKTLAREGVKYNIKANAVAPIAASPMTATVFPKEILDHLKPELVAPVVAWLAHEKCPESGQIFETGAGWVGKVRWEQTKGAIFKTDDSFTPSAVFARWKEITDFSNGNIHASSQEDIDRLSNTQKAQSAPKNDQGATKVHFQDQVILVTGAGAGLGRAYSLMLARLGAKVVVNDMSQKNADAVVQEIKSGGGQAVAVVESVEKGQAVADAACKAFGTVHGVINNAGILRDKSFASMTEAEWDAVYATHLKGSYSVTHALWPIFLKQKYGRVINTASIVGVHGNFGQANYSTAKAGLIGLSKALAREGQKYNIFVNCIVPTAGTAMTATIWPEEMLKVFSPDFVAPPVGFLVSPFNKDTTGSLFEISGGWVSQYRWQRSYGKALSNQKATSVDQIASQWGAITRFDSKASNPSSMQEGLQQILDNFNNAGSASDDADQDPEDPQLVRDAKSRPIEQSSYSWSERDCMLYNLGIGATEKELQYTFEGDENFQVLPTFGVIPTFASTGLSFDWLPNFSPMMLLHGEQYLALKKWPLPTEASVINKPKLLEVLDKGKAAAVTTAVETFDKGTGEPLFVSNSTVFIRGSGGFGGKKNGSDRGPATAVNTPPKRDADYESEFKTDDRQAAIYRLSGDRNPLHIDPSFAAVGGFKQPILHGLCSFGIAGKAAYDKFGPFKDIKVRFAGHLFPGETLITSFWKDGDKVLFVSRCKERGTMVLSNAAVTLAK